MKLPEMCLMIFRCQILSIYVLELKASSEFQKVIEIVKYNVAGFLKGINKNLLMDIFITSALECNRLKLVIHPISF